MADIEIPGDLILPEPRDEQERQVYSALIEKIRELTTAIQEISELI